MHPRIQHRCDYVAAEHQQAARAVAAIFTPVGLEMPTPYCRFKVLPATAGWYVVDSVTGKVLADSPLHNQACIFAQRLERLNEVSTCVTS